MEFNYYSFDAVPYLRNKTQPIFVLKDLQPDLEYWTLHNVENWEFVLTKAPSQGVRVPVFAVITATQEDTLSHGSLLFSLGLETACKAMAAVKKNVHSTIIAIGKDCHAVDRNYRAYVGITFGVKK